MPKKLIKPRRWVRTIIPKHEVIPFWYDDQMESTLYFMNIVPTRGARGFENIIQNKKEILAWTNDTDSDIPFFFLRFKDVHRYNKKRFEDEREGLRLGLNREARIAIRPSGTAVDSLIVAVRYDRYIYVQGGFPNGGIIDEIKFLCDVNNIQVGVKCQKGAGERAFVSLPWKE